MPRTGRTRIQYEVGDVIRYQSLVDDMIKRIIITKKVKLGGFDGFFGILEQTQEEVEGYDLNVQSVVRRK